MAFDSLSFEIVGDLSAEAVEGLKQIDTIKAWMPWWTRLRARAVYGTTLDEILRIVQEHKIRGSVCTFGLREMVPIPEGVCPADMCNFLPRVDGVSNSMTWWMDYTPERCTSFDVMHMKNGVCELASFWEFYGSDYAHARGPVDDAFKLISETNAMACAYFAEQRALIDRAIVMAADHASRADVERVAIE